MEQLGIGDNTIRRARIFLKEAGEINYCIGKHKGAPTRYWITSKGAKMEPFGEGAKQAKMEPFEEDLKGAKMEPKEANLVVKGSPKGTLNNKVLIKSENKNMPDNPFFTEEDKEGIRAYAKSYGVNKTTDFLVHKGCDPESIREILEGLEEQKYCLRS